MHAERSMGQDSIEFAKINRMGRCYYSLILLLTWFLLRTVLFSRGSFAAPKITYNNICTECVHSAEESDRVTGWV